MTSPATFKVATGYEMRAITGTDTTILSMPKAFYIDLGDGQGPALAAVQLGRFLRNLAYEQARSVGELLHHAEFVITSDWRTVQARGSMHDCEECRAGVRDAIRRLQEDPDLELIVGQLWWAEKTRTVIR